MFSTMTFRYRSKTIQTNDIVIQYDCMELDTHLVYFVKKKKLEISTPYHVLNTSMSMDQMNLIDIKEKPR